MNKAKGRDALDAALDLSNALTNPVHKDLAQKHYDWAIAEWVTERKD